MIRRSHETVGRGNSTVIVWGAGTPQHEFLHVDDMADASLFVPALDAATYQQDTQPVLSHINVGTGEVTIRELAETIAGMTGFKGALVFDSTKPDGAPRRPMSVSRLASLGWRFRTDMKTGLESAYARHQQTQVSRSF